MTTTRPDAAGGRYEVQARRMLRRGTVVVSDETRHATTTNLADAQCTAHALGLRPAVHLSGGEHDARSAL
jgi:hypothetical protein